MFPLARQILHFGKISVYKAPLYSSSILSKKLRVRLLLSLNMLRVKENQIAFI